MGRYAGDREIREGLVPEGIEAGGGRWDSHHLLISTLAHMPLWAAVRVALPRRPRCWR
jgi:hypothetical protein